MKDARTDLNPDGLRVVVVLQGGGALGAYHGGVCQALYQYGLAPDWIAGVSIGALSGAILAGNEPQQRIPRLREFWTALSQPGFAALGAQHEFALHHYGVLAALRTLGLGVPGMFRPRLDPRFALGWPVAPQSAGLYDTAPLQATLQRLTDFAVLNSPAAPRYSAAAITVCDGRLVSFDSAYETIGLHHVRASAAVPPAFAPVCVDGTWYWDGGLYSNTPLQAVFDDPCGRDSLVFLVDVWNEDGGLPATFDAAMTHRKDAIYGTRSRRQLDDYLRMQRMRALLHDSRAYLPPALREQADAVAAGGGHVRHVVRLRHAVARPYAPAKDLDFTAATVQWRWQRGYADTCHVLDRAPWLQPPPDGAPLVIHEPDSCARASEPDHERKHDVFPA
jgi:NTE family protein